MTIKDRTITVKGKNGTLTYDHRPEVKVTFDSGAKRVQVETLNDERTTRAYHGMTRALVQNMVKGVSEGFRKELDIIGVGWTAKLAGGVLELSVGYADVKKVPVPAGVKVEVINGTRINVTGPDAQKVGQFAAQARSMRKPEPYNGKGVKYVNEFIQRKSGKAFGTA